MYAIYHFLLSSSPLTTGQHLSREVQTSIYLRKLQGAPSPAKRASWLLPRASSKCDRSGMDPHRGVISTGLQCGGVAALLQDTWAPRHNSKTHFNSLLFGASPFLRDPKLLNKVLLKLQTQLMENWEVCLLDQLLLYFTGSFQDSCRRCTSPPVSLKLHLSFICEQNLHEIKTNKSRNRGSS